MRGILRYLYKNLLPIGIGHSIDIFKHLRMQEVDGFQEKKVLILSPHPDDDIIGCGGAICMYHLRGAHVTSVYMTDGRKGNFHYSEDNLVSVRKEEARRAAKIIGIDRLIFLNNRDSELSATSETVRELSEILKDVKPEAIFLPFLFDNHPDHLATNKILLKTMSSTADFLCYAYGVWTPLPTFNASIDITPCLDKKNDAINQHKSQIELADLSGAAVGLAKYYSAIKGGKGFAEVFITCPSNEYRRLMEVVW